jgi:hypothetical protein
VISLDQYGPWRPTGGEPFDSGGLLVPGEGAAWGLAS